MDEQLIDFFKTFADASRLRLAGLLLEESLTIEEIAARLRVKVSELPRQLSQLDKLGLLVEENGRCRLDVKALEQLSRAVLANQRAAAVQSNDENADDFDRKIVKNYSYADGRLKELPGAEKKLLPVLRHVAQVFEPGVRYNEKQVNAALARFHPDYASLRRYLVDKQVILRTADGASYWREENKA